jgi:spore coat protein U-like protein
MARVARACLWAALTAPYKFYTTAAYNGAGQRNGRHADVQRVVHGSFAVGGATGFKTQTVYGLIGGLQNVRPGGYSQWRLITVIVTY